jgi:hypothetical protein
MSQQDELFNQASAAHRTQLLIQWGCGIGALAVTLTCLAIAYQPGAKLKTVTPVMLWGCALSLSAVALGESQRRDYELARDTHQNMKRVLGYNAASWLNLMTQPNKTALRQIEAVSTVSQSLPLFDWSELADGDNHPTLAIISPMGGGKSRLAKFLARGVLFPGQSPELRAIDIYGRPAEWQDAALVTDHGAMLEMMRADIQDVGDRVEMYRDGQDNFTPLFWIFEEAPDTIGTLRKSSKDNDALVTAWVTKATTVARKVKARLCLVSVRLSGAEIGVSAEARNDATVIFPGRKGVAKAMGDDRIFKLGAKQNRELREQLTAALANVKRPALIYSDGKWFPAAIPELDAGGNVIGGMTALPTSQPGRSLPPAPQQLPPLTEQMELDALKAKLNDLYLSEEFDIQPHQETEPKDIELEPSKRINQIAYAIFGHLKEKQVRFAVSARDVISNIHELRKLSATSDEVREAFLLLAKLEKGTCEGEDNKLTFTVYWD